MPVKVGVRIYRSNELIQEFSSISKAADYIKELAFTRLQKKYTRAYITRWISDRDKCGDFSNLDLLRLKIVRSRKCIYRDCNIQVFEADNINFPSGACFDCNVDRDCCCECGDGNLIDDDEYKGYICPYCDGSL